MAYKNIYEDTDLQLWKRYKAGDKQAQWELLSHFKGMIMATAIKQSNVLPRAVVEAKLKKYALMAFDSYDPTKGVKLSTHVTNYMQKINRDNYENQQAIRLPENVAIGYSRFMTAKSTLQETLGREPNHAELAEHLGWSLDATANAAGKYHQEFVTSKLTFEGGTTDKDTSASVLRFAYYSMSDQEKYLFEHKTGYMGAKIYPLAKIQKDLKLTAYQFNKMQKDIESKLRDAAHTMANDD